MGLEDVKAAAQQIFSATIDTAQQQLTSGRAAEVKRVLTGGQRDLRDLKRRVVEAEREARVGYSEQRNTVDKSGQFLGTFMGSKARGSMARSRAADKRRITGRQAKTTAEFRDVKSHIDDLVTRLDNAKFSVDSDTARAREQTKAIPTRAQTTAPRPGAALPPPPPTPATWAPDPFGRHELRYWDGLQWTEHVATGGAQSIDPPN